MKDKKNIKRLFSQVKTIVNCYEKMNLENGNNFNIFTALKIESNEVVTHSRFIGELLNPSGLHGLGTIFLDSFLEQLNLKNNFTSETSETCEIVLEEYQGEIDDKKETGGRLDILIKDKTNGDVIMIENKIYAPEQPKQLMRYHNAYKKGELFYLTLFGESSKEYSRNCIDNDTQPKTSKEFSYKCISYQNHIVNWLESCQKHTHNRPFLRETLSQYLNLVKKLTNQNINGEMNKELAQLFSESEENFDVFQTVLNLQGDLRKYAITEKMFPALEELQQEFDGLKFDDNLSRIDEQNKVLCSYENKALRKRNLKIEFKFTKKNTDGLIGGFVYLDMNAKKEMVDFSILKTKFENAFENEDFKDTIRIKEDNLPCFDYWHFMNLNGNPNDLKNLLFGDFKTNIKQKIEKMIEIAKETQFKKSSTDDN